MTLECELNKSDQTVEWLKDGKKLKPDKHTKVKADGTVHQLILENAKVSDSGEYTAKVPQDKTTAKLLVQGEYHKMAFHFTKVLSFRRRFW